MDVIPAIYFKFIYIYSNYSNNTSGGHQIIFKFIQYSYQVTIIYNNVS